MKSFLPDDGNPSSWPIRSDPVYLWETQAVAAQGGTRPRDEEITEEYRISIHWHSLSFWIRLLACWALCVQSPCNYPVRSFCMPPLHCCSHILSHSWYHTHLISLSPYLFVFEHVFLSQNHFSFVCRHPLRDTLKSGVWIEGTPNLAQWQFNSSAKLLIALDVLMYSSHPR